MSELRVYMAGRCPSWVWEDIEDSTLLNHCLKASKVGLDIAVRVDRASRRGVDYYCIVLVDKSAVISCSTRVLQEELPLELNHLLIGEARFFTKYDDPATARSLLRSLCTH